MNIGPHELILGDAAEAMPSMEINAVITDPPYSARTHKGHDAAAIGGRESISYSAWGPDDVARFVPMMCAAASGWVVIMTDHVLAPSILSAMIAAGRYAFAPLPYFAPGSRVRLAGDGPSCWTIWLCVARTTAQVHWGTLPGGYMAKPGWRDREYIGGKPLGLMQEIVRDYTAPGDTVLDPFMGSGTTGAACIRQGRRFVGIERDPIAFELARSRIESEYRGVPFKGNEPTLGLFP